MITRAQIRRQLRSQGGIMNAVPRQGYFLGGIGKAVGKAVGKVGDVVGQITKSDIGKMALLAGTAYATRNMGPIGEAGGWKKFLLGAPGVPMGPAEKMYTTPGTKNILSRMIGGIGLNKATALGAGVVATGALLAAPTGDDAKTLSMLKERGEDVEGYLRQYYKNYYQSNWQEGWTQEGEDEFVTANMSKGGRVGLDAGGPLDVMEETVMPPISDIIREEGINVGPQVKKLDAGAKSVTKEGDHTLMASETNPMAELYQVYLNLLETDQIPKATTFEMFIEMVQQNQEPQPGIMAAAPRPVIDEYGTPQGEVPITAAKGGRVKYASGAFGKGRAKMILKDYFDEDEEEEFKNKGGRIGFKKGAGPVGIEKLLKGLSKEEIEELLRMMSGNAQGGRVGRYLGGMGLTGLPGIPRMAPDGLEYDMRGGGFQPLGAKEGKDDVKANLAKNEFVMTADAVRGAGGGDIELGAQKMYDTMKHLEGKIA